MAQSDHSARRVRPHGPKQRSDSTRPPSTGSRTRHGGDRRPWPTASTTTRVSPAKPGTTTRTRSRGSAAASSGSSRPTPATVWTAGATPIDLDTTWPTPTISTIVRAFSKPGERVVLLPWPTTQPTPHPMTSARHHTDAADALATVESLDRTGRIVRVAADTNITGPASRPFWADLVGDPDPAPTTAPADHSQPSLAGIDRTVSDDPNYVSSDSVTSVVDSAVGSADLIITSLRPDHDGDQAGDVVALVAARLLRVGGILVVLTHCDWLTGELIDPTGAVVASAQNADLLYLQHIVALHVPVRGGRFATELLTNTDTSVDGSVDGPVDGSAAETQARAEHRAAVRGLPAPHRRVHSDVLVFAQPHEHHDHDGPHLVSPAKQACESGVLR